MYFSSRLLSAIAAIPLAAAAPAVNAASAPGGTVVNYCPKALCVYTTQPGGGPITNTYTVQPGKSVAVLYPASGATGSQVQVSPTCSTNNVVYWEFSVSNNLVYYDVNIQGPTSNPFAVRGNGVNGSTSACPAISCEPGQTSCFNNPNGHEQNQVKACASSNSLYFNACKP